MLKYKNPKASAGETPDFKKYKYVVLGFFPLHNDITILFLGGII